MRILRFLFRWLFVLVSVLIVAIVFFLSMPGLEIDQRYPAEGEPWLKLYRGKPLLGTDVRAVGIGPLETGVILSDVPIPFPGTKGLQVHDGTLWYIADQWIFSAGVRAKSLPGLHIP